MTLKYIVTDTKYQNINQVLKQELHISARLQHKLITEKHVLLNGIVTDTRFSISKNDIITVNLDFKEESENIVATKMQLGIIYEDDAFLVLNKPAGIAVHPSILHYKDSLSNGVKFYFESIGLKRKIRPVNRLDLNTSGLIVFSKNEYIQECLIQQMNSHIFKKDYLAIVVGHFDEPQGTINLPIARKENSIIERCISENGQEAITDYKVLKERVANDLSTHYSDDDEDLANISSYDEFLNILVNEVFMECARILRPKKYMCLVVSDFRNKSEYISFHSDLIQSLNKRNTQDGYKLSLQGTKILLQNHKSLLPYGYPFAYVENIHHQYVLIFRKDAK